MGSWVIEYIKGTKVKISQIILFLSQTLIFALANSVDPDEMLHYAAFHLVFTICQSICLGDNISIHYFKGFEFDINNLNELIACAL